MLALSFSLRLRAAVLPVSARRLATTVGSSNAGGVESTAAAANACGPKDKSPSSSHLQCDGLKHQELIDRVIRVDHAGEYGAVRIYEGQLAVLRGMKEYDLVAEMKRTEDVHLEELNGLVARRRARPTLLMPFWHVAGFALGAGTALLGKEAAMACTVAVEEVIGEHYNNQIRTLLESSKPEPELLNLLKKNRDEELDHYNTGVANNAEQAPFYQALSQTVKAGCRAAIWLSERV